MNLFSLLLVLLKSGTEHTPPPVYNKNIVLIVLYLTYNGVFSNSCLATIFSSELEAR